MIAIDPYVTETLLRDLVGHDHRPSAFLVYLYLIGAAPSGRVAYDENGNAIKEIQGDLASKLLKQAAEEMGQLPNRVTLDGRVDVHTSYTVVGVEPEDLE